MDALTVREGLCFGRSQDIDLHCDIYSPEHQATLAPAIVLLHGRGSQPSQMREYAVRFAAAGFVCLTPEYRIPGRFVWPTQIENVKAAIRWCRGRGAEFGIDPSRVVSMGTSAGGHLALLAAGTPGLPTFGGQSGTETGDDTVAAAIGLSPMVLCYAGQEQPEGGYPMQDIMGEAATPEAARIASPLTYAASGFPPTFLLHGSADTSVPVSASVLMYQALVGVGVPVELHVYADQPHNFPHQPAFLDLVTAECVHFLRRQLGAAQTVQP